MIRAPLQLESGCDAACDNDIVRGLPAGEGPSRNDCPAVQPAHSSDRSHDPPWCVVGDPSKAV